MNQTRTALIIGAGIAGPVAAMALQRVGITAEVHEAYGTAADGLGGALSIAPNGLAALRILDADDVVRAIGQPMSGMIIQSWTGRVLGEFRASSRLPDSQLVWRDDLYRALYDEAERRGIVIRHGQRLVDAVDDGSQVTARFADGSAATADVLIGADGIRSTVRRLIDPAAPEPRYAGLLGFGARTPGIRLPSTGDRMHLVFGKRAFLGYQVGPDGDAGYFVNLPGPRMSTAEAKAVGAEEWLWRLRPYFSDDRSPALEFLAATDPADLVITGALEDVPTVPHWTRGRMVLIGDAAHATSPSSGQGASLAIESAVELARCLRDLPAAEAFAAYESLRRARVERVIAMAARTNSDKAAGPVARVVRDAVMPVMMKFMKPEQMDWQFAHTIDWDAPVRPGAVNAGAA